MQPFFNPSKLNRLLRFKPTLGQLMDLCEENYRLLLKLSPELHQMQGHYHSTKTANVDLHLEILEQSRYTTLLRLTYLFADGQQPDPDTTLRVYHDSRQLEIIDLKQKRLFGKHSYQHPALFMKWRANVFINKWLSYCIKQQHSFNESCDNDQCLENRAIAMPS